MFSTCDVFYSTKITEHKIKTYIRLKHTSEEKFEDTKEK